MTSKRDRARQFSEEVEASVDAMRPSSSAMTEAAGRKISLAVLQSDAATDQRLADSVLVHMDQHIEISLQMSSTVDVDVILVLANVLTENVLAEMTAAADRAENPAQCMVLVTGPIRERQLTRIIACGVVSILPRRAITPKLIARAVLASSCGQSILSERVTRWLIDRARVHYDLIESEFGVVTGGLTVRETDVLRLLAEGWDTEEIAEQLHYSERTIKKIIHDLTLRLNLRNRTHAVSYALRVGAI